ncbi:MAG: hypothetical protein QM669_15630 [Siphonobacter sp.]
MASLHKHTLLLCILSLSGCQRIYNYRLGAGMHTSDLFYQAKPVASPTDSLAVTANYIGGIYSMGYGYPESLGNQTKNCQFGLLQISRAHAGIKVVFLMAALGS